MYLVTFKSQFENLAPFPDFFTLTWVKFSNGFFLGRQIHVSTRLDERNTMVFFF